MNAISEELLAKLQEAQIRYLATAKIDGECPITMFVEGILGILLRLDPGAAEEAITQLEQEGDHEIAEFVRKLVEAPPQGGVEPSK